MGHFRRYRKDHQRSTGILLIGQVGFVLIAIAVGGQAGYAAAVLFAVVNSLNKALLFLSEDLRGWLVSFAFVVGAFSVVGVPPAGGFLGKAGMFNAAVIEERWWIVALVVVGSLFSFVYMFQAFQRRFWIPPDDGDIQPPDSPASLRGVVVVVAILTLAIGFWPEPILWISHQAALAVPLGTP